MNAHLENIWFDAYSLVNGFFMIPLWNYPEAYIEGKVFAKNITGITSRDRTTTSTHSFITSSTIGNITMDTIYSEDIYGLSSIFRGIINLSAATYCMSSEMVGRHIDINNIYFSLRNPNTDVNRFNTFVTGVLQNDYIKNFINITNFYAHDIVYGSSFPLAVSWNLGDEVYLNDITYDNVITNDFGLLLINSRFSVFRNFTFINTDGMTFPIIYAYGSGRYEINDFSIKNFTGVANAPYSLITLQSPQTTQIQFDGVFVENSQMFGSRLINLATSFFHVVLKGVSISNSTISSGKDLIYLSKVRSIDISEWTISKFVNSDDANDISKVLSIGSIDLSGDYQDELYEVRWLVI
jgi:hypothetical protein